MPPNKSKRPCREEGEEVEKKNKRPRLEQEEEDMDIGGLRSPASSHNKPAELFRKDLISAMKMADTEQLDVEDYLLIADPWRQDWEKGVQVPVNEDRVKEACIKEVKDNDKTGGDFKIPRKYLHGMKDETFQQGIHELTGMQQLADQVIRYDLDDLDVCWLNLANEVREETSEILIDEWVMEQVIEALETQCHEVMQIKMKTEEGLGIEYDEDIVCAVCASPESEECNEMVFCDGCDICVHQACYGIQKIPEGSWLCRTCALGIKPTCILCPKTGGAMKSTRASRWSLICCLCKERCGACIQCSVKSCKTAFHVSCAFQNNLEMKTILTDEVADDGGVKLKAYCPRHSKKGERRNSESDSESPRKSIGGSPRKELSDEEIAKMRAEKMQQLNEDFYTFVNVEEIAKQYNLDESAVEMICVYWKLKRKAQFDVPLLTPKKEEEDLLEKQQEDSLVARMKMFVQLRQDLERVRNLCYMVSKREKMKKQFYKDREAVFMAMNKMLTNTKFNLAQREVNKIVDMYHFDSIYDTKVLETVRIPPETAEDEEEEGIEEEEMKPKVEDLLLMPAETTEEDPQDQKQSKSKKSNVKLPDKSPKSRIRQKKTLRRRSRKESEAFKEMSDDGDTEMTDVDSLCSEPRLTGESRSLRSQKSPGSSVCEVEMAVNQHNKRISPEKTKQKEYVEEMKPQVEVRQRARRESFTKAERELRRVTRMESSDELSVPDIVTSSKSNVVSDKVKEEVNAYLRSSKLVISDKIKNRVHRGLERSRSQIANIASGYVQTSLDTLFKNRLGTKSPIAKCPSTRSPTPKSPVSRVLNEISPSRTRHGSSNSICRSQPSSPKETKTISEGISNSMEKNLIGSPSRETRSVRRRIDNVFDVFHMDFGRKSSRENSPESSVRSFRQLRSLSPASINSELVDVENLYESDNTLKRITRSQGLDSAENSRDSFTSSRSGKMQPPPRKVKYTTALKNIHSEQVSKLQSKVQQDCDLLDDIRNFSRQRSIIEKEYGQALLKLTTGLLKREFQATPDLQNEDGIESKTALEVWRLILEETEKLAKARLQVAEILMEGIAEPIKPYRMVKQQIQKRLMPQLNVLQNEVGQTVLEMAKAQKEYSMEESLAHDARVKSEELTQKLAKRSSGIFQSKTSLQKQCAKFTARRDAYNAKSVLARNDYLLHIAAANAHQSHYYNTDLLQLMKALDGDMYEKILEYFHTMGKALLDVSSMEKSASETITKQADMICRDFNHQVFMYRNPVYTEPVQYVFQPCQNDECNTLSKEHNGGHQLDKEARKWATKIAKETRSLRQNRKTLQALENLLRGDKASDGSNTSEIQELEMKIDEMREVIRKSEIGKAKAEARIALLRKKVNVDEWLASAQAESLRAEEEEQSLRSSQGSVFTDSSIKSDEEPTYTNYDYDDDFLDDEPRREKSIVNYEMDTYSNFNYTSHYPQQCRAIYDFQGSNVDELNLRENEELEIIADGDGDGWLRARNSEGLIGMIPSNYIEILGSRGSVSSGGNMEMSGNGSHVDSGCYNDSTQEVMSYSSGDMEVQHTTNQMPVDNHIPLGEGSWARAIYDYEACSGEELSFITGTLIRILRKDENGVDDGFWEGELNGRVGVFPSLVVEELGVDGNNGMMSPEEYPPPPSFVPPPPVTITAATPESEHPPSINSGYSLRKDVSNGDDQVGHKRVRFQERTLKNYTQLKSRQSGPRSQEEICVFDAEFGEEGEESLV
ncbi:uncharacterized protein LOC134246031 [Saccostrea cucullata]|uniref:uncharacterized protein LOC134246031 n=1 Tax=Saccostrea cuccullata TaxID=36930 RepID=UPI002ED4F411